MSHPQPIASLSRSKRWLGIVTAGALVAVTFVAGVGAAPAQAESGDFTVYDGASTAPVLMDATYAGDNGERDYRQVRRAAQDFRQDVAMVTGAIDPKNVQSAFVDNVEMREERLAKADQSKVPAFVTTPDGQRSAIIIGTIGQSALVDQIIAAGKFDETKAIAGQWEAYATKAVDDPLPGLDRALVIAGTDARGTIYGIYSMSEAMGVSPFYWYADVPVQQRATISLKGKTQVDDGPDVQYRGIFINDEERSSVWAKAKFPTANGTPDVNYHGHVYELMLRLRLNTLWPAMHPTSTAFNAVTETGRYDNGTPLNAKEASEFGIVASASHAEMMLRSNENEWKPWFDRNKNKYNIVGADWRTAFDYSLNKPAILQYWRERVQANAQFENILPLGIRGVADNNALFTPGNPYGFKDKVEMQADVIKEQRQIIADIYGSPNAVPQVFIPYKEMNDLYNAGLKKFIPEDVILMWAEDNYGYLRQVPTGSEARRSGGNGVYYHNSYWGEPKSYLWLNSTPMSLMVQQLQRAWNSDAGRYWVLNVGDIKPGEIKLDLFSRLAWDVEGYDTSTVASKAVTPLVERDFGLRGDNARIVAEALRRFDTLENTKRAEFWGEANSSNRNSGRIHDGQVFPFSAFDDGDEVQRYINEANAIVRTLEGVSTKLDPAYRSTFYQQVLYRVRSYRNQAEHIGYYWKNQFAASQGRYASAGSYELLSKMARQRNFSDEDYWDSISSGKWEHMISHSHPEGFPNEGAVILTNDRYARVDKPVAAVGAGAEGSDKAGQGELAFNSAAPEDQRYFDVFSRNDVGTPQAWIAEADAPWVVLSQRSGTTATEQRITVSVAPKAPAGTAKIRVYNASGGTKIGDPVATFPVTSELAPVDLKRTTQKGHLEGNGYVALEAEHFATNSPGSDGSTWSTVHELGQRGATMGSYPETAARVDADFGTTAKLAYRVYFTSTGTFKGNLYRIPTLNEGALDDGTQRTTRTAIGLAGAKPQILEGTSTAGISVSPWGFNIMRQIEPLAFTVEVTEPGWHDLNVYRSDAAILFDRIMIETKDGSVGDGLVGPPESPNNIAAPQRATVAALPATLPALHRLPTLEVEVGKTVTVEGVSNVQSATSDNETAAAAAVDNGALTVSGRRVGKAEISITAGGESWILSVIVTRSSDASAGPYLESDGQLVIDPTDALADTPSSKTIASNNGTHSWALARNGVQAVPVASSSAKANWIATSAAQGQALLSAGPTEKVNGSAAPGTPPRMEFTISVEKAGTYYLFVNSSHPNGDGDSYHVYVDDQWKYQSGKRAPETGTESWYGSVDVAGAGLALTAGTHKLTIAARESGIVLNQLALTTNKGSTFSGFLPPSGRGHNVPGMEMFVGKTSTITGVPSAQRATSDNENALTVSVRDGVVTATGKRAGKARVAVTGSDGETYSVPVDVLPDPAVKGAYQEQDGQVVIDPAGALADVETSLSTASNNGTHSWALTRNGVQAVPSADASHKAYWLATTAAQAVTMMSAGPTTKVNGSTAPGTPPRLDFTLDIHTAGTYYLFANTSHPNADADSYHVFVDGEWRYGSGKAAPELGVEKWFGSTNLAGSALELSAGEHKITIAAREAGIVLNQVVLTTKEEPGLTGFLVESARG